MLRASQLIMLTSKFTGSCWTVVWTCRSPWRHQHHYIVHFFWLLSCPGTPPLPCTVTVSSRRSPSVPCLSLGSWTRITGLGGTSETLHQTSMHRCHLVLPSLSMSSDNFMHWLDCFFCHCCLGTLFRIINISSIMDIEMVAASRTTKYTELFLFCLVHLSLLYFCKAIVTDISFSWVGGIAVAVIVQ